MAVVQMVALNVDESHGSKSKIALPPLITIEEIPRNTGEPC